MDRVNKELLTLEFIRDSPAKFLKRKNLYDEFGEDFIEGLHTKGYITHTLAPDTFLITIKGRAYIEKAPVTPGVTSMTGDIWNRMTPIERERLGIKAGFNAEDRGKRWLELWGEQKRALIREYKKEAAIPKAETDLYWYSVSELKQMCRQKGLSTEGSKEDLIRRLRRP